MLLLLFLTLWLLTATAWASDDPSPVAPAPVAPAGTIVGGTIIVDTTWTLTGSPYMLQTQHVTVADGVTLTIDPGVLVQFNAALNLSVNGTLLAVGTPAHPITFTRSPGSTQPWGAIQIGGGSVVTDSNASHISYATIEGGGAGGALLWTQSSAPTLDHLTLRNSSTRGLYAGAAGSPMSFDTGTVTGNTGGGIYVASGRVAFSNLSVTNNGGHGVELQLAHDSQVLNSTVQGNAGDGIHADSNRLLLQGLTISGNAGYGIYMPSIGVGSVVRNTVVQSNAVAARLYPDVLLDNVTWTGNARSEIEWIAGFIHGSRTWARMPEINTYRVLGGITALNNAMLSVEPGVTVQIQQDVSIFAFGDFSAVGTASQPILFTRLPGATQPWGMIQFGGGNVYTGASRISYATIEGGGKGPGVQQGQQVEIYLTSASMDHITVRDGAGRGIHITPYAGARVNLDTVAITNNAGDAVYHTQPGPTLSYRHLTLQGNGTDAVSIAGGSITSPVQWDLGDAGAPVRVAGLLSLSGGGALALMPGTRLEFPAAGGVEVWSNSGLYALGTAKAPVTLTGQQAQPGAWKGVWLHGHAQSILRNCNVEYGGAAGEPALRVEASDVTVYNSSVRHAAGDGVLVNTTAPPVFRYDDISGNLFGMRNGRPTVTVDARQVWWGDATGPNHTSNPDGLGNSVSNGVLFQPWLTTVPTGTVPLNGLIVRLGGATVASPGQSVVYGATYLNETGQEIRDAVLVLLLPGGGAFEEAYRTSAGEGRGIYWPEQHQVFWRLGTLPPGASGTVAVRVRFDWGLPGRIEDIMALMAGSNQGPTTFDLASYLAYVPLDILSSAALTPAEVAAERQAYPALDAFFRQGEAEGFVYASAGRHVITGGRSLVVITLQPPDRSALMQITREGQLVQAQVAGSSSYTLRTGMGDMMYDRATNATSFTGSLAGGAGSPPSNPGGDLLAQARNWPVAAGGAPSGLAADPVSFASPGPSYPTEGDCMRNCAEEKAKTLPLTYIKSVLSGKPPILPPGAAQYLQCEYDCQKDPTSHYCVEDDTYCDVQRMFLVVGPIVEHRIMRYTCDTSTGKYEPNPIYIRTCPSMFPRQKCVYGPGAQPLCVDCPEPPPIPPVAPPAAPQPARSQPASCATAEQAGGGCDFQTTQVHVARDPNAKYGPAGDLLPGESVPYTVTYENVGEGIAYGVYVEDRLSEHFDESTLVIGQGGLYLPASRTILWEIGELGPEGSPTASGAITFTAHLRSGLPGGTAIVNQAVVYFPSVPEETPTNPVANVIWPVVGVPVSVTVQAGHSVPVTLAGRDTGQGPLTFAVVNPPARGVLSGAPPALTYTPLAGFTGDDRFTFKASNAITDSRPAEVRILVLPDPSDTTVPAVSWTAPRNNAVVPVSASPVATDTIGPGYTPFVILGFSETIDASTVTTATLRVTGPGGAAIPVTVGYSGIFGEAMALLRQPLEPATWYTVRVTPGVKDLAGNPLAADFVWTFRTAGGSMIYLPLLRR